MDTNLKLIPVVILHYNSPDETYQCIRSFETYKKSDEVRCFYVVIDSGSLEENINLLETSLTQSFPVIKVKDSNHSFGEGEITDGCIVLYKSKDNIGYSKGNNIGFKLIAGNGFQYGILANPDTKVLDEKSIGNLIKVLENDSNIIAAFPRIMGPDNKLTGNNQGPFPAYNDFYLFWYCGFFTSIIKYPWAIAGAIRKKIHLFLKKYYPIYTSIGCFYALNVKLFQRIGFFDEDFFLYMEEQVLAEKSRNKGLKIVMVENAIVKHNHHYMTSDVNNSLFKTSFDLYLLKYRRFSKNKLAKYYTVQNIKTSLKRLFQRLVKK